MIANFRSRLLLIFAVLIIILSAVISMPLAYIVNAVGNTIYPMTAIDNIDMGKKTKEQATEILKKKYGYLDGAIVEAIYKDQPIATFSASQIGLTRDIKTKIDQAYIVGRTPHFPSRLLQQINALLKLNKINFYTQVTYDLEPFENFIEVSESIYNKPAKNALFKFENGRVTNFKAHEDGLALKSDEFLEGVKANLNNISPKSTVARVVLSEKVIEPEITLAKANNQGIEELIAEGESNFTHSIPTRIHNIQLAASKFNGQLIPKGATFSFNEIVGDISSITGYQPAYVIQNGKTVLGDGGGVCQVSTTMFRAALNAGLPIVERHAHAYRVSYYEQDSEPGFDATIYSPSVDLKFKNDTASAILIQTEIDEVNSILTFKFYGKKDDRKVEISKATVWDVAPPPEALYEDDPTLPSGEVKQVDFPAWGAKAKFTYKVTYKDGEVKEETFFSTFRPWRAVYLKGTKGV